MSAVRLKSVFADLAEGGVDRGEIDAEDVEALVYACARCDSPYSDADAELCGRPVRLCRGVYLWPMTAGADVWMAEYAERWWPRGSLMHSWARLYALRHARDPEAFAPLVTKWRARAAVLANALRIAATRREIDAAVARCYGRGPHDAPDDAPPRPDDGQRRTFARFAARLEVASGIPARDWLWGRGLASMLKSYCEMREMAAALGGGRRDPRLDFELDDALSNLARVKARIVRKDRERKAAKAAQAQAADAPHGGGNGGAAA